MSQTAHLLERCRARLRRLHVVLKEGLAAPFLGGGLAESRIRDPGVVDEQVETAAFGPDPLGRGGDGSPIGDVDLQGDRARPDLFRGSLTAIQVARPEVHRDAVGDEFLPDLKADALISARDEGDACVTHRNSSSLIVS